MANEISQVRTYFKARIAAADSDFREWKDGFNFENIPRTIFKKSYHLLPGPVSSGPLDGCAIIDESSWELRLFFKGFRDPAGAIDSALDTAHAIRKESIKPVNAFMSNANIKNVVCNSFVAEPLGTNDNAVIVLMNFNVTLLFSAAS